MTITDSILATLAYHDIFDYPLTKEEIHNYLIGKKTNLKSIEKEVKKLAFRKKILSSAPYFALIGRSKIFKIRISRQNFSKVKLKRAYFYATILTLIPS